MLLILFPQALRELIFGTATGPSFNAEWRRQNFVFCDVPKLQYGLIQHKVLCYYVHVHVPAQRIEKQSLMSLLLLYVIVSHKSSIAILFIVIHV